MPIANPFAGYLEDRPEANYFSFQNQWSTPNQKAYFKRQFGDIQNQYLGQLGQWIRAGSQGQPEQFSNFLQNYNWGQNFREQGPQQDISRFNPFTRWAVR